MASSFPKISFLTSTSSNTASKTKGTPESEFTSVEKEMRSSASFIWSAVIFSFLSIRSRLPEIVLRARAQTASLTSTTFTWNPDWAATWAIPAPMLPAPATPTVRISSIFIVRPPLDWMEWSSSALKNGLPLLRERGEPLLRVVRPEVFEAVPALHLEGLLHGEVNSLADRGLDVSHGLPGPGGELPGERHDLFHEFPRLDDPVDEADLQRLLRPHRPPAQEDVHGPGEPDQAGKPLGPARAGEDPQGRLRQADQPFSRRHEPVVARERQFAAPSQGVAVDGGDHHLLHAGERVVGALQHLRERLRLLPSHGRHLLDVRASDKRLLQRAGDDHDRHLLHPLCFPEGAGQLLPELPVERVRRRPVQGDRKDPAL